MFQLLVAFLKLFRLGTTDLESKTVKLSNKFVFSWLGAISQKVNAFFSNQANDLLFYSNVQGKWFLCLQQLIIFPLFSLFTSKIHFAVHFRLFCFCFVIFLRQILKTVFGNVWDSILLFSCCCCCYRVYQGLSFNLGNGSKMIIFGSLLTTFKVSYIFGLAMGRSENWLKPNIKPR